MKDTFFKVFKELALPWVKENVVSEPPPREQFEGDEEFQSEVGEDCTGLGVSPLREFVGSCDLKTSNEDADPDDEAKNKVCISTIHRAKGREWDTVFAAQYDFLPSMCRSRELTRDGRWIKLDESDFDLDTVRLHEEEEMRIAHVAVTRAKRNLYISLMGRPEINPGKDGDSHIIYRKH